MFAQRELDFSLLMAGAAAAAAGVVGVAARVMWGRRIAGGTGVASLLLILALGAIGGTALLLLAGQTGMPVLMWAGVALHGATVLGVNVVVMAGAMREVEPARVGAASGVVSLGMYVGFASGPLAMGLLLQYSGGFLAGWLFVASGYLLCVVLGLVLRRMTARTAAVAET
jgi:MFS family permease